MDTMKREFLRKDMSVLRDIENPESEHVFLYFAPTIEDQLKVFDGLLHKLNDKLLGVMNTEEDIPSLLNKHRDLAKESAETFKSEEGEMAMAVKRKAPSPCPGGASSCLMNAEFVDYFDLDCNEELKIFKNDELIESKTVSYDELTKIRTIKLAEKLVYTDDDNIRIELPVTIHNEDGSAVTKIFSKQISGSGQ